MVVKAECGLDDGYDVVLYSDKYDEGSFGLSAKEARQLAAQLVVAAERAEESRKAKYENLLEKVRALPPMTPAEREEQSFDWAYGNLGCTTNHKPTRAGFKAVALEKGWTEESFDKWAEGKEWW